MNTCINCGREVSSRAKYCSDRCRKSDKRNSDKPGQISAEVGQSGQSNAQTRTKRTNPDTKSDTTGVNPDKTLTKTDQTFYDRQVRDGLGDYYYFTSKRYKRRCTYCSEDFVTSLKLLKCCSYEHYSANLSGLSNVSS